MDAKSSGRRVGNSRRQDSGQLRQRLTDAFTKIAAERGYAKTTVKEVVAAAGVSRSAFYGQFESKRQCLIAAYDAYVDRLMSEVDQAMETQEEWPLKIKAAVVAGLGFVTETASFARLFAVEAFSAGPAVLDRGFAGMQRVVLILRTGRDLYPEADRISDLTEPVLVAGITSLVTGALLSEEEARLAELEPPMVEILLTPYLGVEQAKEIAQASLPV